MAHVNTGTQYGPDIRLQNALKVIDIHIREKPKHQIKQPVTTFKRNCLLEKELKNKKLNDMAKKKSKGFNKKKFEPRSPKMDKKKEIELSNSEFEPRSPEKDLAKKKEKELNKIKFEPRSPEKDFKSVEKQITQQNKGLSYDSVYSTSMPRTMTYRDYLYSRGFESTNSDSTAITVNDKKIYRNIKSAKTQSVPTDLITKPNNKSAKTQTVATDLIRESKIFHSVSEKPYDEKQKGRSSGQFTVVNGQVIRNDFAENTHTPYGESALFLINQIRERFNSAGDNVGSALVNQIEAFIGNSGSGKLLQSVGRDTVFGFTPVPSRHKGVQTSSFASPPENRLLSDQENIIKEQQKKIEELENSSNTLFSLCEKLLSRQKKMKENLAELPNVTKKKNLCNDEENIEAVIIERDELSRKVEKLSNILYDLERELHSIKGSYVEKNINQGANTPTSNSCRQSTSNSCRQSKTASEVDSAFEDKTVSHSTSKRTTPFEHQRIPSNRQADYLGFSYKEVTANKDDLSKGNEHDLRNKIDHLSFVDSLVNGRIPKINNCDDFLPDSLYNSPKRSKDLSLLKPSLSYQSSLLSIKNQNSSVNSKESVELSEDENIDLLWEKVRAFKTVVPNERRMLNADNLLLKDAIDQKSVEKSNIECKISNEHDLHDGFRTQNPLQNNENYRLYSKVLESTRISQSKSQSDESFISLNKEITKE